MHLFRRGRAKETPAQERLYAAHKLAYTAVDYSVAFLFVVGSVMFLSEAWQVAGTWCFLAGSICFAAKPTLRLVREMHSIRVGDTRPLARPADG